MKHTPNKLWNVFKEAEYCTLDHQIGGQSSPGPCEWFQLLLSYAWENAVGPACDESMVSVTRAKTPLSKQVFLIVHEGKWEKTN